MYPCPWWVAIKYQIPKVGKKFLQIHVVILGPNQDVLKKKLTKIKLRHVYLPHTEKFGGELNLAIWWSISQPSN